eukprot:Amastigsp_a538858_3.p1 type:complete len:101 gc:universal Amastigsp_a538858_3:56-358(+)
MAPRPRRPSRAPRCLQSPQSSPSLTRSRAQQAQWSRSSTRLLRISGMRPPFTGRKFRRSTVCSKILCKRLRAEFSNAPAATRRGCAMLSLRSRSAALGPH